MTSTGFVVNKDFYDVSSPTDLAYFLPTAAGRVNGSGNEQAGFNFSSERNNTGKYTITITNSGNALGIPVITPHYSGYTAFTTSITTSSFKVTIQGGGSGPNDTDATFSFIFI